MGTETCRPTLAYQGQVKCFHSQGQGQLSKHPSHISCDPRQYSLLSNAPIKVPCSGAKQHLCSGYHVSNQYINQWPRWELPHPMPPTDLVCWWYAAWVSLSLVQTSLVSGLGSLVTASGRGSLVNAHYDCLDMEFHTQLS